MHRYR